jgi:two-component system response regulator NreC
MPIRILLADDHNVLRAGLRTLLNSEPDFNVVGEAADGNQVLQLATILSPDLVLMDLSMPGLGGIEATKRLKEILPETHVLILTMHEDETLLRSAIQAGASGYVIKRAAETELTTAIQAISRGDMYIHPAMTRALFKDLAPAPPPESKADPSPTLTKREIDVLRMIARGYTNSQIAEKLSVSPRTVEGHRANLMAKLNLRSRVELVEYAESRGLLE